jgi:alanine racemase
VTVESTGPHPERALARVDLEAVERNCRHLCSLLQDDAVLCAVVKADGYGHGGVECARAATAGGAGWLAVATAGEAEELREAGIGGPLLVMGALIGSDLAVAARAGADVVAWDPAFVPALSAAARAVGQPLRVHMKLDTGMGRLGTRSTAEAHIVAESVASDVHLELVGLMTHFATADEPGDDHFPAQLEVFSAFAAGLRNEWPDLIVHAANSAAVYRDPAAHFDMARCGIAVYGLDPRNEDPDSRGLVPALSLHSYVAAVKRFEPGDSAGYGRRWSPDAPTWVAVLPIGYGDGVRRALTNNADVLIGGRRRPLVGTVSMDNITVELGPETDVRPGVEAVLIGRQGNERILCEEMAHRLETINYEVTCGLSPRVRRVHEHR